MDEVWSTISFGVGRKNKEDVSWHPLFNHPAWELSFCKRLKDMAKEQLGTIGSGNHYVDILVDEQDYVWVGVHFGSRGLGHKIATFFLEAVGAENGMDAPPAIISTKCCLGMDYLAAMDLAGQYAYAGRDWVCNKVACIIAGTKYTGAGDVLDSVHNHHNYAWKETHDIGHGDEELWVVRKGATRAFPGQRGFVGGTMTENAVILEGVDSEESRVSLFSTVHGAGRVMGRMEAKGKIDKKTGEVKREGKVTQEMWRDDVQRAGIELRGAGVDESSFCYKRLDQVLQHHQQSIRILHVLRPIGVADPATT